MNFQQLRYVRETVRRGLNLTEAANALHTSQPGVSKQIRELEHELGFDIFVRHGKRITSLTEPGKAVLTIIERVLQEAENLKRGARLQRPGCRGAHHRHHPYPGALRPAARGGRIQAPLSPRPPDIAAG